MSITPGDLEAVKEVLKHGNSLHSRVVRLLRGQRWEVLVSPYYSDNFTDKPREIDVIAEREYDVHEFMDLVGILKVQLFIECKNINEKIVFWFDEKDINKATELIQRETGMADPAHNVTITKHHYYNDASVAKLFASSKGRSEDNEIMSRAINQNLNAFIYHRGRIDQLFPGPRMYAPRPSILERRVQYPIIVVNSFDNFFGVDMSDDTEQPKKISSPFQLEVNYAYVDQTRKACNEYFLIDVVSLDTLPSFLAQLDKSDINIIKQTMSWEHEISGRPRE